MPSHSPMIASPSSQPSPGGQQPFDCAFFSESAQVRQRISMLADGLLEGSLAFNNMLVRTVHTHATRDQLKEDLAEQLLTCFAQVNYVPTDMDDMLNTYFDHVSLLSKCISNNDIMVYSDRLEAVEEGRLGRLRGKFCIWGVEGTTDGTYRSKIWAIQGAARLVHFHLRDSLERREGLFAAALNEQEF
ncbi:hypothetical protein M427DRAFT_42521 [Gonapodya prolifera JEL478]|uniref:Uncharacterized protein n=1 Tax=Gonapodya prolifera (strain JEL478) TaxID=1344416 RepID=A0A139AP09_GONPJ|nr:hypothetical protein M427DRAFT_42521 [Gonapodya prolifera JEL478]|eukprot:KXS18497.1 hypothetical protein M427DRAFT_42521 [Gonapodya prolifera JEL478]